MSYDDDYFEEDDAFLSFGLETCKLQFEGSR